MSFQFRFEPATDPNVKTTLLLLHGTGGTEHDLVGTAKELLPGAAILSPRGKLNEGGATRWFRRFAEGVFDEDSIKEQAANLAAFLKEQDQKNLVALGYSNGANMGAALMTLHPEVLEGLIMWRGMKIFQQPIQNDLTGKKILMTNGIVDQMGPIESARQQAEVFRASGADVSFHELGTGHGLSQADFELTQAWLKSSF